MAAVATAFRGEGTCAVVALTAEFASINFGHFDCDRSLFHFGEGFRVVAFFTFNPGISVDFSRKSDLAHWALGELESFP